LLDLATPAAEELGCTGELAEIERLLDRGTGAEEQRQAYEESEGSLLAVARRLAEETVRHVQ